MPRKYRRKEKPSTQSRFSVNSNEFKRIQQRVLTQTSEPAIETLADEPSSSEAHAEETGYVKLVGEWAQIKTKLLAKYAKDDINKLHSPRKEQVMLIDAVIYYLDNLAVLDEPPTLCDEEKSNILLGGFALLQKEIEEWYAQRITFGGMLASPDNSCLYENIDILLEKSNVQLKQQNLDTFLSFVIDNKLLTNPSQTIEYYTTENLQKYYSTIQARCNERTSFFSRFSFGLFGSTSEQNDVKLESAPVPESPSPSNTPA